MDIYIHFNGYDCIFPSSQEDVWSNYKNPDAAKMFLVTAHSWARQGWIPKRLVSRETCGFKFKGKLQPTLERWPLELWNVWLDLLELAPCWFCTTDCYNNGFKPQEALHYLGGTSMNIHWTMTCMFVTQNFCEKVIAAIEMTDKGTLAIPETMHISDEQIIRKHFPELPVSNLMAFPYLTKHWEKAPLLHFARSTLQRALDTFNPIN